MTAHPALDLRHELVDVRNGDDDVRPGDQARTELPFGGLHLATAFSLTAKVPMIYLHPVKGGETVIEGTGGDRGHIGADLLWRHRW